MVCLPGEVLILWLDLRGKEEEREEAKEGEGEREMGGRKVEGRGKNV